MVIPIRRVASATVPWARRPPVGRACLGSSHPRMSMAMSLVRLRASRVPETRSSSSSGSLIRTRCLAMFTALWRVCAGAMRFSVFGFHTLYGEKLTTNFYHYSRREDARPPPRASTGQGYRQRALHMRPHARDQPAVYRRTKAGGCHVPSYGASSGKLLLQGNWQVRSENV